jgi:SAM-dependent methyltransferase
MKAWAILYNYGVRHGDRLAALFNIATRPFLVARRRSYAAFPEKPRKSKLCEDWVPSWPEYEKLYSHFLRYYYRYTPCFRSASSKPKYLLDVGCGDWFWKRYTKQLEQSYFAQFYVGVDPCLKEVQSGKNFLLLPDAAEHMASQPDGKYDVVWHITDLCHVEDDDRALRETKRVLRDKGSVWIVETVFRSKYDLDKDYVKAHNRFYTKHSLLRLVRSHFQNVRMFRGLQNHVYVLGFKGDEEKK